MKDNFDPARLKSPTARGGTPRSVAAWILFAAACNAAGWILSALHRLDVMGYLVFFAVLLAGAWIWRRRASSEDRFLRSNRVPFRARCHRQRRRFRRPFPLAFLLLASLAALGGLIHAPNNYDALAYRTPRVLHWLAEEKWHWIHTGFQRLNTRGCGIEWLTAPVFIFFRTDRFDFLLNFIPFLLLPGRVFSLSVRLGVRNRVAWHWMWLLPTAYGYLLQAGSIGNDLFGAWFALAAIELALRARDSGRPGLVWLSLLAAALATATKAFNVLLILPWGLVMLPVLQLLLRRPLATVAIVFIGMLSSIAPTCLLNHHYVGDWSGRSAEPGVPFGIGAPAFHLAVNTVLLGLNNLTPPIFPFAHRWQTFVQHALPAALSARLREHFEPGAATLRLDEMPVEENAGLGFGISVLLILLCCSRLWAACPGRPATPARQRWRAAVLVPLGTAIVCLFFLSQSGLSCPTRYLAPFYPLLSAPLLSGARVEVFVRRSRVWRWWCVMVFVFAAILLVSSPSRPLWPATTVLRCLGGARSLHPIVRRAWTVYEVYGQRADAFEAALRLLPPGTRVLGMVTFDDPESTLWRPFGSRRIIHVCEGDSAVMLRARGIRYIWVNLDKVNFVLRSPFETWLARMDGEVLAELSLRLRAGQEPIPWRLVRIK